MNLINWSFPKLDDDRVEALRLSCQSYAEKLHHSLSLQHDDEVEPNHLVPILPNDFIKQSGSLVDSHAYPLKSSERRGFIADRTLSLEGTLWCWEYADQVLDWGH